MREGKGIFNDHQKVSGIRLFLEMQTKSSLSSSMHIVHNFNSNLAVKILNEHLKEQQKIMKLQKNSLMR